MCSLEKFIGLLSSLFFLAAFIGRITLLLFVFRIGFHLFELFLADDFVAGLCDECLYVVLQGLELHGHSECLVLVYFAPNDGLLHADALAPVVSIVTRQDFKWIRILSAELVLNFHSLHQLASWLRFLGRCVDNGLHLYLLFVLLSLQILIIAQSALSCLYLLLKKLLIDDIQIKNFMHISLTALKIA